MKTWSLIEFYKLILSKKLVELDDECSDDDGGSGCREEGAGSGDDEAFTDDEYIDEELYPDSVSDDGYDYDAIWSSLNSMPSPGMHSYRADNHL